MSQERNLEKPTMTIPEWIVFVVTFGVLIVTAIIAAAGLVGWIAL